MKRKICIIIRVDEQLHRRVKAAAAKDLRTMQAWLITVIQQQLKRQES